MKESNSTHGFIRATVNIQTGPEPIDAIAYRARTLNANRYLSVASLEEWIE